MRLLPFESRGAILPKLPPNAIVSIVASTESPTLHFDPKPYPSPQFSDIRLPVLAFSGVVRSEPPVACESKPLPSIAHRYNYAS